MVNQHLGPTILTNAHTSHTLGILQFALFNPEINYIEVQHKIIRVKTLS